MAGLEANESAHKSEHSLEVELPFLQQTLTDFKIVPILLGQTDDDFLASLAQAIAANFDDQTLLVISSDLSHYPDYQTANRVDNQTIEAIISGDLAKFAQIVSVNLDQPGVETCACGQQAIKVGLIMANQLKLKQIKLLNYANSGDVTNDKTRVVGYASIGFFGQIPKIKTKGLLNSQQQQQLLAIARQTLEAYFQNGKIPDIKVDDPGLSQALGAFVTLKKDDQLRGCIGEFEPKQPLYQVVWQKAIDAAIHDSRFMPVTKSELKDIMIEISVLSPRQKINDWQQIKLGQHGVVVKKGLRGGTFLPQVATETGWDLKTFLSNLCSQKAGLASDCYQDPDTEIFVFTAQVFSEAEGL